MGLDVVALVTTMTRWSYENDVTTVSIESGLYACIDECAKRFDITRLYSFVRAASGMLEATASRLESWDLR